MAPEAAVAVMSNLGVTLTRREGREIIANATPTATKVVATMMMRRRRSKI